MPSFIPPPPSTRYCTVVHRLKRRLRLAVPSLKNNRERLYILEILLRKHPGIRQTRLIIDLGQIIVNYQPTLLPEDRLLNLLETVIPNLGHGSQTQSSSPKDPTDQEQEHQFAIEGLTCTSCALLIELVLRRDPRVLSAIVNRAAETARVRGYIDRTTVFSRIGSLGYKAIPLDTLSQRKALMDRESERLNAARRRAVLSGVLSLPVFFLAMLDWRGTLWRWAQFAFTTPVVLGTGGIFFTRALGLARQKQANMDSLISLGVGSAYAYSTTALLTGHPHLYYDAAAAIISLVLLGRYLEERARGHAHEAIRQLVDMQPRNALLISVDGEIQVEVDALKPGDLIRIKPGSRIPTDGTVITGHSTVDESLMTGESLPVIKEAGQRVIGGCINGNGVLTVRVDAVGGNTVLAGIIHMVDQAQSARLPIQKYVDRVSAWFVPGVMFMAGTTLVAGWLLGVPFSSAFARSITVLLIACPCALGLATPAAIMVGAGQAARRGIYIRNGVSLEMATHLSCVVFDKTGTITEGKPCVTEYYNLSKRSDCELLTLMAAAESGSEHFLAKAVVDYATPHMEEVWPVEQFKNYPGQGISAIVHGQQILLGNTSLLGQFQVDTASTQDLLATRLQAGQTPVFCAVNGQIVALMGISDSPRPGAAAAIQRLHQQGITTLMATGDIEATARQVAEQVGILTVMAEARPEHKLGLIKRLQERGERVGMIGDGINDAPALAAADVGFAIGTGSDIAMETADMTLRNGDITRVADAIVLSTDTLRIIRQNLAWAFIYNVMAIPVAALGKLNPMLATMAMALSSLSVVINSLRLKNR